MLPDGIEVVPAFQFQDARLFPFPLIADSVPKVKPSLLKDFNESALVSSASVASTYKFLVAVLTASCK